MDNVLFDPEEMQGLLENIKPEQVQIEQLQLDGKAAAELEASQKRCEEYIKKNSSEK